MSSPLERVRKKRAEAIHRILSRGFLADKRVYVGMATCEIAAGSQDVWDVFEAAVRKGLASVYLSRKGCSGRCNLEPTVEVVEQGRIPVKYGKVTAERAQQILERHIKRGEVIQSWVIE
jgi:(2Fe-2S) ferredoxin